MCGIIGYVGRRQAVGLLVEGLKRLEYRGYDSAGIAIHGGERFYLCRKVGRVANLEAKLAGESLPGTMGISHTRWATHGEVTEANAHPHCSSDGLFALVHNGVVENHGSIRRFLVSQGYSFLSETDSEVLTNLIAYHYAKEPERPGRNRFSESVRRALSHVEGTYGLAVLCRDQAGAIVCARKGSPLIIGLGEGENLVASDASAFVGRTRSVVYLNDGNIVFLTAGDFSIMSSGKTRVEPVISTLEWEDESAELGVYRSYMEKEIHEQPESLANAMRGRFSDDESTAKFGGLNHSTTELRSVDRLLLCGCGSAWHACLILKHLIERFARIPVDVEYASEFRYRNAPLGRNTLVLVISQSGETLDTLEALREVKRKGFRVLAVTNVVGSTIARESDGGIYQHAGPEIGVASTKAFTSQVLLGAMLALHLGRIRDMSFPDGRELVAGLRAVPNLVERCLAERERIRMIAERYSRYEDFLFLGRQLMFPVALEGALKLKEITYIHAEGYPAAEMKHGPIALVSPECPSVFIVQPGIVFAKTLANIQEVKARNGPVICVAPESSEIPPGLVDELIRIPDCHEAASPILATIPLQLLSLSIAEIRGCDVDKPRNLAKSVTVE